MIEARRDYGAQVGYICYQDFHLVSLSKWRASVPNEKRHSNEKNQ